MKLSNSPGQAARLTLTRRHVAQACTAACMALIATVHAQAQTVPEPADNLTFNVGAVSEYRYRAISQTAFSPAVQGGIDYANANGLYVGNWASQIRWIREDGASDGQVEHDIYGGYKGNITADLTFDVGYLRYQYWGSTLSQVTGFVDPGTNEVYGALSYGVYTAKISYAFSNLFGTPGSNGSTYTELVANYDLGHGYSFAPHLGHQEVAGTGNSRYSYDDVALTLGKDFGNGWSASLAAVATDAQSAPYTVNGRKLADPTAVLGAKYTF